MNENLPAVVEAEKELAVALSKSDLVPRDYRGKPANVLLAVGLGRALGLEPAVALVNVTVIDGTPTLSAQAQAALVRRAGHRLRVTGTDTEATAVLIRSDDPDHEHTATWTIGRAKVAGLAGRGAWRQYPQAMLQARAITEVVRMAASDVLLGCSYTPEELGRHVEPDEPEVEVELMVEEVAG